MTPSNTNVLERFKDRTAPISTLSEPEKLRFHRAIYRAWIISVLSIDNENPNPGQDEIQPAFLSDLTDEELVELFEVVNFLDTIGSAVRTESMTFHGESFEVCEVPS